MTNEHAVAADNESPYSMTHLAAFGAWQAAGWSCAGFTDTYLDALLEDKNFADEVRTERQRRAKAATAAAAPAPRPATAQTRTARKGEDLAGWVKRAPMDATPIGLFHGLFAVLKELKDQQDEKRENLEARVQRLESMLVLQTNQIKNLETSGTSRGPQWGGEFESGKTYTTGEFVGYKKGVWVALRDCATAPGAHLGDWDLVIAGSARP